MDFVTTLAVVLSAGLASRGMTNSRTLLAGSGCSKSMYWRGHGVSCGSDNPWNLQAGRGGKPLKCTLWPWSLQAGRGQEP